MLKWASIPTAVVFVAAIAALTWTMTLSPARAAAQGVQGARAYITVQIVNGVDSVSWYDPDGCSSDYNIYLSASTPVPGSTPQITRTHLGSAASGSTAATLPISHSGGGGNLKPTVIVELYCGEYDSGSSTNDRVARTALSVSWSGLWSGTFSSAPLTALSVSGATLSPSFNRGKISYTAEVAGDVRMITVNATGLSGYQFDFIKNTIWNVFRSCDPLGCYYSYGDGTETGIVLTDSDPNMAGFQIELEGGENRLGIGMHKGDEDAGARLYGLTVTVANIPATGKPTVSGTTQVGQTLRASTSAISDEDGLEDADFSYQWLRVESDSTESEISGATRSSYTLVSADTGKSLKVRVTFTDDSGNSESLTSAASPTVTAAAALSADATLSALTLSGVNFATFAAATTSYSARVNNSVSETTVTPTMNHLGASHVIKTGGTEDADGTVSLAVGSNAVTVVVTAEDGQTTKTYTVAVTRLDADSDPISSDASLSGLTLSGIDSGTFESDTTSYIASAPYSVAQTTVTPTVSDSGASYAIKRNGVTDSDGTISLRVGSNVIAVVVTAEDESTTQTYNVTVTRADPPSTDATLKILAVNGDKFTRSGSKGPHYPISYVRSFRNNVTEVTVTPTVNHPGASYVIKVGGGEDDDGIVPLAVGGNHVTIEVTAEDGVTKETYNLSLTRDELSTDARLNRLLLSGIDFGSFISTTESYTANVANSVSRTTVTPTVMDSGASYVIKLGGVEDEDGTVSLAVGDNVITIEVTAEDGQTTRTYTVTVTRAAPSSSFATLKALSLSGISLGNFKSVTTSYTASVANSVTQTTVTPTLNDDGVSYVIKIGGVEDADGTVSLAVGSNVITVEVTAADDSTTRTYTVTVTRAVTPAPALQTTMATGLNSSYAPPNAGYSQFGNLGSLSDRSFTIDGKSHTVTFLLQTANAIYLGLSASTDRSFSLQIDGVTYEASESSTLSTGANATYWWPDRNSAWTAGQEVSVTITTAGSGSASMPQRPQAPPRAFFHHIPATHDGTSLFSIQLRFTKPVQTSAERMAQHSITVQNGAVESAEMPHEVTTSWVITIRPSGTEDVRVSVAQASQCSGQGALCDSDGVMIYNYPQVVISGPPTISQQVTPENEAATGQPTISGTPVVGNALTADTSAVSDGNGMTGASFSYQWVRDGSTISGATGSTYAVVENDQGHSLKAQVSFTDDDGFDETVTSSAVSVPAPIVTSAPPPAPTDLSVTLNTDGSLTLNWTAPSDDSIVGYQILRRRPQMGEGTLLVYVNDTGSASTTYTDTSTSNNTRYVYRVKALNSAGVGAWSNFARIDK